MNVVPVMADFLEGLWWNIEPHVEKAVNAPVGCDLYTVESVKKELLERNMQLWLIEKNSKIIGAFTTQILVFPKAKVLDVPFGSGTEMKDWLDIAVGAIQRFAVANDCKYIRGYGRLGWAKMVRKMGGNPSIYFDVPVEDFRL